MSLLKLLLLKFMRRMRIEALRFSRKCAMFIGIFVAHEKKILMGHIGENLVRGLL